MVFLFMRIEYCAGYGYGGDRTGATQQSQNDLIEVNKIGRIVVKVVLLVK